MRKVLKLLSSKVFLFSLMILLQLGLIYVAIAYFSEHWKYFSIVTRILAFLVATYIINTPILPEYKIAWLVPVLLAPVVGIPLYLMLGKHNFKKENSFYNRSQSEIKKYLGQHEEIIKRSLGEDYFVNRMGNYVYNSSKGRLNYGDKIKYYPSGETMWSAILEDLKCAKKYIFLEYFIFKPGQIYAALLETLTQKVKDGVEVYLLYDDLGCTYNIPTKYFKKLMKVGVKVRAFQPFRPFINSSVNNRNHRKLCVIDGNIGYTGGINLADEYINIDCKFGKWKDCGIRVEGKTCDDFVLTFIQMWNDTLKKKDAHITDYEHYLYQDYEPQTTTSYSLFVNDSPHDNESTSENVYLKMIDQAARYIYITTPYLVIDHSMKSTLILAAHSGIDVRIIIPGVPDKKITYQLTKAFASQLVKEGVKVYFYKPGFIHAKSFICDDLYSVIGTANLDYRSLYLHYECSLFVCDKQLTYSVKEDYQRTLDDCEEVTSKLLTTNVFTRAWRALLRMLAPLF